MYEFIEFFIIIAFFIGSGWMVVATLKAIWELLKQFTDLLALRICLFTVFVILSPIAFLVLLCIGVAFIEALYVIF